MGSSSDISEAVGGPGPAQVRDIIKVLSATARRRR